MQAMNDILFVLNYSLHVLLEARTALVSLRKIPVSTCTHPVAGHVMHSTSVPGGLDKMAGVLSSGQLGGHQLQQVHRLFVHAGRCGVPVFLSVE